MTEPEQAPTRGLFFCLLGKVSRPAQKRRHKRDRITGEPRRHATAAGHVRRAGRNGLGGSKALIVKEQGLPGGRWVFANTPGPFPPGLPLFDL